MNNDVVPLNPNHHQGLRLLKAQPYHHAAGMMLCPVGSSEMATVARDYVIVFPMEADGVPQVLLGSEAGRNAYLSSSGHWLCRYVPAHVRRFPFVVGHDPVHTDGSRRRFSVLIQEDAPHFSYTEGELLFQPDGQPAPLLQQVQKALSALQADHLATQTMVQQLDALGLLVARSIVVHLKDGKEHALSGFRMLDVPKFQALDAAHLAALHGSGALMLAYAHIVALSNLRDGVLVQRTRVTTFGRADVWRFWHSVSR